MAARGLARCWGRPVHLVQSPFGESSFTALQPHRGGRRLLNPSANERGANDLELARSLDCPRQTLRRWHRSKLRAHPSGDVNRDFGKAFLGHARCFRKNPEQVTPMASGTASALRFSVSTARTGLLSCPRLNRRGRASVNGKGVREGAAGSGWCCSLALYPISNYLTPVEFTERQPLPPPGWLYAPPSPEGL